MDSNSNINLNDKFYIEIENQPFFPKLNFINSDKFELIKDKQIKFIITLVIYFLGFYLIVGIISSIYNFILERKIKYIIFLIGAIIGLFLYFFVVYHYFPKKRFIYFDRDELQLKLIYEKYFCFKTQIKCYNLYDIKSFSHIFKRMSTFLAIFKFKYNDKEIEFLKLIGNYPEIYKSLEIFLNLKLQEITKRNYNNNEIFY